jgi:hypothetical protein
MAQAGAGDVYASGSDPQGHATSHDEDEDHIHAGMLALGAGNDAQPVAFPVNVFAAANVGTHLGRR